ncbi:unnamed protein product [Aureobasidium uvarum]|uniref:BTB domain-containing protein n=1 Tax=Aureobasidium uvarum TaxID=2773716 RepID=A0A9N8KMN3_9PEZI|nr:unnamed protein product [Aureobasidium uvarum]
MGSTEETSDLARFYNNEQFSDVVVKFGESRLYAHKVILAKRSAYFARAFLGQFAVASSSTIDLGDEDDPQMIREMIQSMYACDDTLRPDERSLAMLVDTFIIADKYDLLQLRRKIPDAFETKLSDDYSRNADEFVRLIIARVCGPTAIRFADKGLQRSVMNHCKMHLTDLLQDRRFVEQYTGGTLFDSEFALAFNLHMGKSALEKNGLVPTLLKDYEPKMKPSPTSTPPGFFNDQSLSDVIIYYGHGQSIFAHKIILAAPPSPSYFHRILEESPSIDCIALSSQDEPRLIETLIHDLYDMNYHPDPEDWTTYLADMYLMAEKYGLGKIVNSYLDAFDEVFYEDMTMSKYALQVAKFCGPSALACYADTELSEKVFSAILMDPSLLLDENQMFCDMLEAGTLFNHKFAGRFTTKIVEMLRDVEGAL